MPRSAAACSEPYTVLVRSSFGVCSARRPLVPFKPMAAGGSCYRALCFRIAGQATQSSNSGSGIKPHVGESGVAWPSCELFAVRSGVGSSTGISEEPVGVDMAATKLRETIGRLESPSVLFILSAEAPAFSLIQSFSERSL